MFKIDERGRTICSICKKPCLLLTGFAECNSHDEPYESGIEEEPKEISTLNLDIIVIYCETCRKVIEISVQ